MRTSVSQFQMLVEFMERNGDLSKKPDGPQGRLYNIQCWDQLTEMLNADSTGDTKIVEKWRKVWSDLKNNTKKKYARIYKDATGTGGGPASKTKLTDLEERVMNIIGSQAATGLPEIDEAGVSQEDIQPISASIQLVHFEDPGATENTLAMSSPAEIISASAQPSQLLQDVIEPAERQVPNTPPIPEEPQFPTPLPATPRRRRRPHQSIPSPTRRRTRPHTQSELARQSFVNSDNEWRVFQKKCEEERLRLRERELNQQERWLDIMAQFLVLGNRIVDHIYINNNN